MGEIGSEPSFELACFLAREARDRLLDIGPVCSNCKLRPQAAATHCFSDWCQQCDDSLYASRFTENVPSGSSDSDSDLEFESENSDTFGAEISSAYDCIDYDNSSGCAIANRVRWTMSNIVFEYVRYFELFIKK